jgi:molybdopterin converting factor small subunit
MASKVLIPTALRPFTGREAAFEIEARNVGELLERLTTEFAALRRQIYNERGELRQFVNIYVDDEDIRHLNQLATPLAGGEVVSIIPAIAGGRREARDRS